MILKNFYEVNFLDWDFKSWLLEILTSKIFFFFPNSFVLRYIYWLYRWISWQIFLTFSPAQERCVLLSYLLTQNLLISKYLSSRIHFIQSFWLSYEIKNCSGGIIKTLCWSWTSWHAPNGTRMWHDTYHVNKYMASNKEKC